MGKEAKKKAQSMGITNAPVTTLYGRPRKLKMQFSKYKPDLMTAIQKYLDQIDSSTEVTSSGGGRNNTFYCVAPQSKVYVEISDKMAGMIVPNPGNHVSEIKIYCEDVELVKQLARTINQIWEDGILHHVDWSKIEKKFKVKKDDCIATWNALL